MRLVFLGPPGVGKGTVAKAVASKLSIPQISTGDLLREEVKVGSELGTKAKRYMDRGDLVPDDLVIHMLKQRIERSDCRDGFILDGFPRTVPQAESLGDIVEHVLVLNEPEEEIIRRISGRRTCSK
jgi:adenylate kinase